MRVLQVHNRYREPGGEDQVVESEAELLAESGHVVSQHLVDNPAGALPTSRNLILAPWNPRSARDVRSVVTEFRPDVIHVHNTWFRLSPSVVAAAHQMAPVVMTLHNYRLACANAQLLRNGEACRLCVDGSIWNGVLHNCYRDPISSALAVATIATGRKRVWTQAVDTFLPLSSFASELLTTIGIDARRMVVKDNFVVDPGKRLMTAEASREILFVGRLSREKGIQQLLAHRSLFSSTGLELVVIGDGPLRAEVSAALGASYLGPLIPSSVAARMLQARALLLPSIIYEGQPRTALEAFAAGLPVAGGNQGGLGELLRALGMEWSFDPHREWNRAVAMLASDGAIATGSRAARALWQQRFTPNRAIESLIFAYEKAIAEHQLEHG